MEAQNYYEGIRHVVYVSTGILRRCEYCEESVGMGRFGESINHYIQQHGYKLLHVGQETGTDVNGKPFHSTVAVLGK
ncbi:hypothetical protein DRH29_04750 [candidate division Kazan bacterium]|uniref:Uncharacterized protein n=1 Tax=candidate division Kazan bacterium TaxID=2202143 RepID=A0A420ZBI3_UNCK3|nr:MAG: hypothetical protein DRH29_04750 [candidate division Kazan bacterium]